MSAPARNRRVVVVGSINVDLFARVARHPRPGETVLGEDGSTRPGGKGANQAVAAALAGARVAMVGRVGDDPQAHTGCSLLRRCGVDLTHVTPTRQTPTGLALITVADDGENSIIVILGANSQVTVADVESAGIGPEDIVVVQGELPVHVVDATVAAASRAVVNLAPVVDVAPETLLAADPLVVNEHEALAAARLLAVDADEVATKADVPQRFGALARRLCAAGVPSVVVTLGAQGVVVVPGDAEVVHLPAHRVEVVDTTGAGDCFVGTLAARLAAGSGLVDACMVAGRAAGLAVERAGAQESYRPIAEQSDVELPSR